MAGFQKTVNTDLPVAMEGDFASANPRSTVLAGPNALVAGAAGVIVGRFARARNDNGVVLNGANGVAETIGFVGRNQFALITAWLAENGMTVQGGTAITLHRSGDFWCRFALVATKGQKVFTSDTDGSARGGAAGATIAGFVETPWFVEESIAAGELSKISTRG